MKKKRRELLKKKKKKFSEEEEKTKLAEEEEKKRNEEAEQKKVHEESEKKRIAEEEETKKKIEEEKEIQDIPTEVSREISETKEVQKEEKQPNVDQQEEKESPQLEQQQISRVTDILYVGSEVASRNKELLLSYGITHIINCAGSVAPNYYEDTFVYKTLQLRDSPKEDVLEIFTHVVQFIDNASANGGRVFVHCQRGVSRGPTIALSYIMWSQRLTYKQAYPIMKQSRSVCCPNPGFVFQLLEWEHFFLKVC